MSHETSIFKIKPNGEDLQTLYAEITYNPEFFISIKISPNGQNIAFYTLGIKFSTYIWDISGHNKRLFWENAINPHWSKDGSAIMANYQYYVDWNSASSDIRIKGLNQADKDAIVVENGPSKFYSWYFD
ncbi:MAG: hypothetical protein IPP37_18945 [Saprospiraceae bacterium]|nr:hypothetical protein [Saprospiraceae bacterium]